MAINGWMGMLGRKQQVLSDTAKREQIPEQISQKTEQIRTEQNRADSRKREQLVWGGLVIIAFIYPSEKMRTQKRVVRHWSNC
jgi:hypothetical protein